MGCKSGGVLAVDSERRCRRSQTVLGACAWSLCKFVRRAMLLEKMKVLLTCVRAESLACWRRFVIFGDEEAGDKDVSAVKSHWSGGQWVGETGKDSTYISNTYDRSIITRIQKNDFHVM